MDPQVLTVAGAAVCLLPQMSLPPPVELGERAPTVGDPPTLHLLQPGCSQPPPLASTNLSPSWVFPPSTKLREATWGPHPLWHHVPDFPQLVWVPSPQ